MNLTAIVICRSKLDRRFKRALASVGFADEVLAVERREISDWAAARNEAMERAKGEWVMFVDSDEIISEELSSEIKTQISKLKSQNQNSKLKINPVVGFYFKRQDCFLGKWLNYGETARVRLLRLARKGAGRWERPVHEVWKVGGKTVTLMNPISHYSHQSLDEMVEKLDRYSETEAEYRVSRWLARWRKFARSPSPSLTLGQAPRPPAADSGWPQTAAVSLANLPTSLTSPARNFYKMIISIQMVFFPLFKFIWNYFLRLGVLDGMEGFIHALMMAGHSFLVRAKLANKLIS